MLRNALFIARMDVRYLFRVRETWLWTFAIPLIFFYFLGTVTGRSGGTTVAKDPIAVSIPPHAGFLADQLVQRLKERGYKVVYEQDPREFQSFRRRLTIPDGFTASVLAGKPVKVEMERTGGGMDADYDTVRLNRAVYSLLADLAIITKDGGAATPEAFTQMQKEPRLLTLAVRPAGKRREAPSGFEQSVPGTMVMFTLLVLFTTGGVSLVVERNQGILRRLASSPAPRGAVVLGKWAARMVLGAIQIGFAMAAGTVLFHIRWGVNLPVVALVLLVYGAMSAALGMLLGNFGKTQGQVIGLGVVASNVMAALGGCWWPIEITPRWAQALALFFPTGWAMDALHKLVNFGDAPMAVAPHLAAMTATALVAGYVVARSFRFQ